MSEMEPDLELMTGHLLGLMLVTGEEMWSDMEVEEEFLSVRESVHLPDAECSCVSGPHSCSGMKGWDGAGRCGEAACSLTANCGSSGSSC